MTGMADVVQFPGPLPGLPPEPNWAVVFELRERLFERAVDEALAQRMADELRTGRAQLGPPRLRVVRP